MTEKPDRNDFREKNVLGSQFHHGGAGVEEWLCLCQEEHKEEAVSMVIDLGAESSGNQELDCSLQKLTPNALLPTY